MPVYCYEGCKCGATEHFQRMAEEPLTECPACGKAMHRVLPKRTGWRVQPDEQFYQNDEMDEPVRLTGSPEHRRDVCRRLAAEVGYHETTEYNL